MSYNPLLVEMVDRERQKERFEAVEIDRRIHRAERQQVRQRGPLFAMLTRFLTAAMERQREIASLRSQ